MPKTYSLTIPQVVLGHAYELWGLASDDPNGVLIYCPSGRQAIQIRKRMYAVRSVERRKNTTIDAWGTTIPGRTAWDNLSIYMCYDPNDDTFISLAATFPNPTDIPKDARPHLPRFLWVGTAALIFDGVKIFHPTTGALLKSWLDFPKIPPRVLDKAGKTK